MIYEAGVKVINGLLYTSGAMIVIVPSFLLLLHFSEQRRIKSLEKGLKEFPKLFNNAFSPALSNQTREMPPIQGGGYLKNMFNTKFS
jgi:hypothetical protein